MCTNCKDKGVVDVRVKNDMREIPCGVCQANKLGFTLDQFYKTKQLRMEVENAARKSSR